jgi:hypothetical protein
VVGQAGSSLARTIKQGVDLLTLTNSGADRALVVMSDGEAFEPIEDVIEEAKKAGAQNISVVTVGFGSTAGATIPIKAPNGTITTKKDENGNTVVTQYHPEFLKAAAEGAGGTFIDAGATDKASRVKSALATLRTQSRATIGGETKTPRYQWFLFPALFLLLLDTALMERRGRRLLQPAAAHTAAAVILLMFFVNGCAGISRTQQAISAYHNKQFARSASLFREAITAGDKKPETMYNFGTALVAADSTQTATELWVASSTRRMTSCVFARCSISALRTSSPDSRLHRVKTTARSTLRSRSTGKPSSCALTMSRRSGTMSSRCARRRTVVEVVEAAVVAAGRTSHLRASRHSLRADSDNNRLNNCSAARRAKSATCNRRSRNRTASSRLPAEKTGDRSSRGRRPAFHRRARA